MQMIYNSPNYCVVEFPNVGEISGYEIVDKHSRRETFIDGMMAESFRTNVEDLIATEPSTEEIEDFLAQFEGLMQQPVVLH
jgi:hypothetical protein